MFPDVYHMPEIPAVFETAHAGCSLLKHHRHATPFVTIVLAGGYVEVNDAMPELRRDGAVVVHEAGEEHADRFESDTRCLNVELRSDWRAHPSAPSTVQSLALSVAARRVTWAFYRNPSTLYDAVEELYIAMQSQYAVPMIDPPQWLQRVIDEFPWTDSAPLREAAALAGLHETHFSRAFHRYAGMTANEYRARARVRYASQMLLGTTASISRVAASAGLSDQSHLTRLFSERLGVSPAAYRQTFAR
jgi:AraC-like DNA-binding protein